MGQTQQTGRSPLIGDNKPFTSDVDLAIRREKWGNDGRKASPGSITRETVTAGKGRDKGNQKTPGQGRASSRVRSRTPATGGYAAYLQNTGKGRNASSAAQTPPPATGGSLVAFDIRSIAKDPDPDVPVTISVVQGWALYISK